MSIVQYHAMNLSRHSAFWAFTLMAGSAVAKTPAKVWGAVAMVGLGLFAWSQQSALLADDRLRLLGRINNQAAAYEQQLAKADAEIAHLKAQLRANVIPARLDYDTVRTRILAQVDALRGSH